MSLTILDCVTDYQWATDYLSLTIHVTRHCSSINSGFCINQYSDPFYGDVSVGYIKSKRDIVKDKGKPLLRHGTPLLGWTWLIRHSPAHSFLFACTSAAVMVLRKMENVIHISGKTFLLPVIMLPVVLCFVALNACSLGSGLSTAFMPGLRLQ